MSDPSPTPPTHDPQTGEVFETPVDGRPLPSAARTLADFFRMIERGQFDADVSADLQDLAAYIEDRAMTDGSKLKAKLSISVEIIRDVDGHYLLLASHKITKPTEKRKRTMAWLTHDNAFTPNMPNQGQLFGLRDVTPNRRTLR